MDNLLVIIFIIIVHLQPNTLFVRIFHGRKDSHFSWIKKCLFHPPEISQDSSNMWKSIQNIFLQSFSAVNGLLFVVEISICRYSQDSKACLQAALMHFAFGDASLLGVPIKGLLFETSLKFDYIADLQISFLQVYQGSNHFLRYRWSCNSFLKLAIFVLFIAAWFLSRLQNRHWWLPNWFLCTY